MTAGTYAESLGAQLRARRKPLRLNQTEVAVAGLSEHLTGEVLDMPQAWVRDMRRRIARRARDLQA